MPLLLGHDAEVAEWAGKRLGAKFYPPYVAWGVLSAEGELVAALVFNEFQRGGNISLSLVGSAAIRRDVLRRAARYVFQQLGCTRVTARTRRTNITTRRILGRSWEFEGTAKRWFGPMKEDDALCFALHAANAKKWMR
jgi:RimJ/RimL family protein N-acetyltransferase